MSDQALLPPDFLSGAGPQVVVSKIDFVKSKLAEYDGLYAVVLDNVLTAEECEQLVRVAEARTAGLWEPALVNVGMGLQELRMDTRNCGRIIWDDQRVVDTLWDRVRDHVPEIEYVSNAPDVTGNGPAMRKETWRMTRLNERMRFLKYGAGQYFQPHCDGMYETPDRIERSYFTLHLYLNESDPNGIHGELRGGSTEFHSMSMYKSLKVNPKVGRVLIFQHRSLLHSGEEVLSGTKITLRTDIMYAKA